jgi:hypothetical protein
MIFANRTEAGQELALRLRKYAKRDDVIGLEAPRGGVPVAFEAAKDLGRLWMCLYSTNSLFQAARSSRSGPLRAEGVQILDRDTVEGLGITGLDLERVTRVEEQVLRSASCWDRTIVTAATLKSLQGTRAILYDLAPSQYPKVQDEKENHCIKQCVAHKYREFRAAVQLSHEAGRKHKAACTLGDAAQPTDTPVATRSHQRTCPNQTNAHDQGNYDCDHTPHTFHRNSVSRPSATQAPRVPSGAAYTSLTCMSPSSQRTSFPQVGCVRTFILSLSRYRFLIDVFIIWLLLYGHIRNYSSKPVDFRGFPSV